MLFPILKKIAKRKQTLFYIYLFFGIVRHPKGVNFGYSPKSTHKKLCIGMDYFSSLLMKLNATSASGTKWSLIACQDAYQTKD
jgi:hypothetical protein